MNYFFKIEAYFNKELSELERLVFEQELAENTSLQKEVAAYEMAQSLFDFTAETLPEEEIVGTEAVETAEELIDFVANNLSEEQILDKRIVATEPTIIRQIQPRKNRTAWLAAASMLFIISMIGLRFQSNQASWKTLGQDGPVAVAVPEMVIIPIEKEITPVVLEKKEKVNPLVTNIKTKKRTQESLRTFEPAKVKVVKKEKSSILNLANNVKVLPTTNLTNPLALNMTATEIFTGKVIKSGQTVVYNAESGVVLKEGFHAKAGSSFIAKTVTNKEEERNFTSAATISGTKKIVYQANQSITLKPGFHAKAGTDFVAKTESIYNKEVATNAVISDKESVLVKAGSSITLKPGFHAKAGADFVAQVEK